MLNNDRLLVQILLLVLFGASLGDGAVLVGAVLGRGAGLCQLAVDACC
jgi:hypothetical protein